MALFLFLLLSFALIIPISLYSRGKREAFLKTTVGGKQCGLQIALFGEKSPTARAGGSLIHTDRAVSIVTLVSNLYSQLQPLKGRIYNDPKWEKMESSSKERDFKVFRSNSVY